MIHHRLYCKEDIELPTYSTLFIDPDSMSPKSKNIKFWKDIEYTFIEKSERFSDRHVNLYYNYLGYEYKIAREYIEKYFNTKEESRKIKISRILK